MNDQRINEIAAKWAKEMWHSPSSRVDFDYFKSAILEATEELRRLLDEHAHDFKQLRDALSCSGSDLPQLLKAIEELRKDKERLLVRSRDALTMALNNQGGIVNGKARFPKPVWQELKQCVAAIDSAMESERKTPRT